MQVFFIHISDNLSTLADINLLSISNSGIYKPPSKGNFVDKEG